MIGARPGHIFMLMLRWLSVLLLVLALVASTTMQLMPHAFAVPPAGSAAPCEMMNIATPEAPTGSSDMPCKGMIPVCQDSLGCAVVFDLPIPPRAAPVAVDWMQVVWTVVQSTLAGLTVEPEVSPPIA
ncbi:MAG TPA: hypothetical protein VGD08_13690 [Stellaceae bacterium]